MLGVFECTNLTVFPGSPSGKKSLRRRGGYETINIYVMSLQPHFLQSITVGL